MATTNGQNGDAVEPILTKFLHAVNSFSRSSLTDDGERSQALVAAYRLVSRLESPWDTVARLCMAQPAQGASLKVAKDIELFEKWHQKGDIPLSSEELGKMVQCDSFLLERIVRHLGSTNVLEEVSPGTFKPTAFSTALVQPVFGEWINYLYDSTIPCFHRMPEYLAKTGYQNPSNPTDGIFQYTKGFKGGLFEYYDINPVEGKSFNNVMGGVMAHQAGMLDIYPYERLIEGDSSNSLPSNGATPLLVDVGGNVGHDIEKFRAKHPEVASRLVLQDRPDVVQETKCQAPVKVMAHDFFTPQPVKGARAYYLHGVIHDWSDEPARQILKPLREAMTQGYSKLLVHDHVLPEFRPHPQATAYDLTMMVKVSAFERTESMWRELLESVGFKIIDFWSSPLATQQVIEAELF